MATLTSHTIQAQRRYEARSSERFDRIAYAMALLRLLRPQMTVAVYSSCRYLHVERGRRPSTHEAWATLGVPSHATRQSIASAVVELSGLQQKAYLTDLLCAGSLDAAD
jgi:hypothetical protein